MAAIENLRNLAKVGKLEAAAEAASVLARKFPGDALVQYEAACLHDRLGREKEAIPFYQRAIALGLPEADLRDALLGLGSTFRCLGDTENALRVFAEAREAFPDAREFVVFGAMALHNAGKAKQGIQELLKVIAETCEDDNVAKYRRAIELYAEDLDRFWNNG